MKLKHAEILALFERNERDFCQARTELESAKQKLKSANHEVNALDVKIAGLIYQEKTLQQQLIICDGIPVQISDLRTKILHLQKEVLRKDILIYTKEELDAKLNSLYTHIQKSCPHSFVMQIMAPYRGSEFNEFEDCHHGLCVCIVCGFCEESVNTREDIYPVFCQENAPRIIAWHASAGWKTGTDIWQPLDKILEKYFIPKPRGKQHVLILPKEKETVKLAKGAE